VIPAKASVPAHQRVSKVVAHALRHEPWVYELELDDEGWVPVAELLDALHGKGADWRELTAGDLEAMIAASAKCRYELDGDRIRALYGHSVPGRLAKQVASPPSTLFHGTAPAAWPRIQERGLVPMRRQYVHLSVDVATALQVGRRKARRPLLIEVHASRAAADGVRFYRGNDQVWLADVVPPRFLALDERPC
jgi:putative RNA 2'-phosphotransferase